MAGVRRSWIWPLAVAVLMVGAGAAQSLEAQNAAGGGAGSIAGRLTDLHSMPVEGAVVVVRNETTGAEARSTTLKNGIYGISGLDSGIYAVEAESELLGRGRLEHIFVAAGHETRVQTAMEFGPSPSEPVQAVIHEIGPVVPAVRSADKGSSVGTVETKSGTAQAVAEKPAISNEANENRLSGAKARPDSAGLARGLKPPPPSGSNISAARTAQRPPRGAVQVPSPNASQAASPNASIAVIQAASPTTSSAPAQVVSPNANRAVSQAASLNTNRIASQPANPKSSRTASQVMSAAIRPNAVGAIVIAAAPEQNRFGLVGGRDRSLAIDEAVAAVMQAAARLSRSPCPRQIQEARERVDPVTPVVTTTMSGAELQALPASGRRWQDFVLDTPAAATAAEGRAQASLRGAGQSPAEASIDGASIRLAFGGQGGYGPGSSGPGSNGQGGREQNGMGRAWSGGRGAQVAEAAIREVETAAGNAEAEGLRAAGGRMNVETQGGANGLHGQGFFFDRQNNWGARNPFTQWITETAPAGHTGLLPTVPVFDNGLNGPPEPYTPPDHETVWGIGLGSQIRRNKLFWFAALDSYSRNDPGLATVKHPYLCKNPPQCTEQTGFFAQPTNDEMQALSARLGPSNNPLAAGLQAYTCVLETLGGTMGGASPDCPSGWPSGSPLLGPAQRTAQQWTGFGRLDWQAAERHRFTLEGIGAHWNSPGGGLSRVEETYGTNSFGSSQASEELLLGRWEAFITSNLLAVTQGSLGRNLMSAHAETPSAYEQTLFGPNTWGQLPQIVVDNRYGFTIGNPSRFGQGNYPDERATQAQETVDWIKGKLLVKSGFEVSHNFDATSMLRNQTGTYTYSNVENFASDALVFQRFGLSGECDPYTQPNCQARGCDQTGAGFGNLPCYSYYSQVIGPSNWQLSTNDWAGFVTAQWQPNKIFVLSAGLRWEREQLPPPMPTLWPPPVAPTSPSGTLPAQRLPDLGNDWGPRLSMAVGNSEKHWPVLRLGYGMFYGRTENATVETALTQTGSANGDLNFFMRPTDDLPNHGGGAPPFPYVPAGAPGSVVKPGVVEFAPGFRNPEVHQALVAVEESLPGHVEATASAMVSLGRRLPISIDTNFDSAVNPGSITYAVVDGTGLGPIKAEKITVPFYASWPFTDCPSGSLLNIAGQCGRANPNYQQITQIMSRANSTYEAAMLKVVRYGRRGLSLHAHYTYSHAMDWNPNESTLVSGSDVLDPADFGKEYGTSNLDVRHSAAAMVIYETPWKLRGVAGRVANGWMVSGIGQYHSGLPYTMRTSGSLAKEFLETTNGTETIVGLAPGMNGSGGDNRVYGVGSDGVSYNIGRNTFRYPPTWKADMRLGKKFELGQMRQLELLAESFNLFNHQNVTELETTGYYVQSGSAGSLPTLNFLTGLKARTTAFGQPLNVNATNFYRERQIQVGVRMRF